jgi:hypothetical protein
MATSFFPDSIPRQRSKARRWSATRAKIDSFDPQLASIRIPYAAQPLLPLFHPPVELTAWRPGGGLHFNRRVHFPAVSLVVLTRIEIKA